METRTVRSVTSFHESGNTSNSRKIIHLQLWLDFQEFIWKCYKCCFVLGNMSTLRNSFKFGRKVHLDPKTNRYRFLVDRDHNFLPQLKNSHADDVKLSHKLYEESRFMNLEFLQSLKRRLTPWDLYFCSGDCRRKLPISRYMVWHRYVRANNEM